MPSKTLKVKSISSVNNIDIPEDLDAYHEFNYNL